MTAAASPYQLFGPLPAEQYAALKADIAARGVQVAVEVDEDGNLLDGHHRVRAWAELRAEGCDVADYPTVVRAGLTEDGKREHVLIAHLHRRNLGPVAWADAFTRLAELRGVRLGEQGRQKAKTDTMAVLAREAGVDPRTARRKLAEAKSLAQHRDLAEKVDSGDLEARRAIWEAKRRESAERRERLAADTAEKGRRADVAAAKSGAPVKDIWTSVAGWLDYAAARGLSSTDPTPAVVLADPAAAEALNDVEKLRAEADAGISERKAAIAALEAGLRDYEAERRSVVADRYRAAMPDAQQDPTILVGRGGAGALQCFIHTSGLSLWAWGGGLGERCWQAPHAAKPCGCCDECDCVCFCECPGHCGCDDLDEDDDVRADGAA